jgi:hypothetical protein
MLQPMKIQPARRIYCLFSILGFWLILIPRAGAVQQPAIITSPEVSSNRTAINRYCVSCHNEKLRTAELMLDRLNVDRVSESPASWEKVRRKLRLGAMPPVGAPRPNDPTRVSLVSYLETELDRLAALAPNPGRPTVHRLNRAEYTNAIRDVLNLEIDGATLLPPDIAEHGFDNMGDVLSVSPVLMERYMLAAGKVVRMALGDATARPSAETYQLSKMTKQDLTQDDRMSEDLPFGSRGGTAIRHYFPADGEYVLKIRLQRNIEGYIRGLVEAHKLDVRLDGARVKLFTIGGEHHGRSGPIFTKNQEFDYRGDLEQTGYEFTADEILETRFTAAVGTHAIGVTFLKQSVMPVGRLVPRMPISEIDQYKGGEPAVESIIITGPYDGKGVAETASRRRIFTCRPTRAEDYEPCAKTILATIARRAYRRPINEDEVNGLLTLYTSGLKDGGFEEGIAMALESILAGPDFLFRIESDPPDVAPNTVYRVSDLELASRLSFFLWSSVPDDELLVLAERKQLNNSEILEQQVRRMLADPRSKALVNNFAGQWLYMRSVSQLSPDPSLFPEFDGELRDAFRNELELFFESMLREDRPALEMLTADYTFVNERLARHYGIPNIYGSHFRRVAVTDEARKGLLAKGGILAVTSYGNRTSPVLRGKWVLEQVLGMPPPPPPPDVPPLDDKNKEGKALTMRQMMEQHRANPACASCHKLMDPIGFALENFDAVGAWRTTDGGSQARVDVSGQLFDGNKFENFSQFRQVLLTHSDQFVSTATEKLLTYALGRGVENYDEPAVRKVLRDAAASQYRWSSLILGVVKSTPFQMRRSRTS